MLAYHQHQRVLSVFIAQIVPIQEARYFQVIHGEEGTSQNIQFAPKNIICPSLLSAQWYDFCATICVYVHDGGVRAQNHITQKQAIVSSDFIAQCHCKVEATDLYHHWALTQLLETIYQSSLKNAQDNHIPDLSGAQDIERYFFV